MNNFLLALALFAGHRFIAKAADAPAPVLKAIDEAAFTASGALPVGAEYHLIREDATTGGVQALVRFPKGYSLPAHSHDYDETLVVVSGKVRLKLLGGAEKILAPGDYAALPAGSVHEVHAEWRKGVVMLLTTSGPFGVKPAK